jgi:hypothetical protein
MPRLVFTMPVRRFVPTPDRHTDASDLPGASGSVVTPASWRHLAQH